MAAMMACVGGAQAVGTARNTFRSNKRGHRIVVFVSRHIRRPLEIGRGAVDRRRGPPAGLNPQAVARRADVRSFKLL